MHFSDGHREVPSASFPQTYFICHEYQNGHSFPFQIPRLTVWTSWKILEYHIDL